MVMVEGGYGEVDMAVYTDLGSSRSSLGSLSVH